MNRIKIILISVGIGIFMVLGTLLIVRFLFTEEDSWICKNGEWVKHGQPLAPKPNTLCDEKKD